MPPFNSTSESDVTFNFTHEQLQQVIDEKIKAMRLKATQEKIHAEVLHQAQLAKVREEPVEGSGAAVIHARQVIYSHKPNVTVQDRVIFRIFAER